MCSRGRVFLGRFASVQAGGDEGVDELFYRFDLSNISDLEIAGFNKDLNVPMGVEILSKNKFSRESCCILWSKTKLVFPSRKANDKLNCGSNLTLPSPC